MKALVEKFLIFSLFLACIGGQSALAFQQIEIGKTGDSSGLRGAAGDGADGAASALGGAGAEKAQSPQTDHALPAKGLQEKDVQDTQNADMQFPVFRTLGGMGLVICLMIGIYLAAKRVAPRYFAKGAAERNMKIVETLSMGDRRSIAVVEVGGNRFLIGNTTHQISLLAALPNQMSLVSEPDAEPAPPKEKAKSESGSPFRNLLEVAKGRPAQPKANPLPEDIRTKMRQLRDALER
jgi:flagellar biosynthetic protein FliO